MKQMIAAGLVGAVIGVTVHAYAASWGIGEPSNANECIMEKLEDMKTRSSTDMLSRLCRFEYGNLQRGDW